MFSSFKKVLPSSLQRELNFIDSEDSSDNGGENRVFTQNDVHLHQRQDGLVDLPEGGPPGHECLKPVLNDWVAFGGLYGSLSEWAPGCLLEIGSMELSENGINLWLRDSETSVCAALHPKYHSQRQFLTEGSIVKLARSSGEANELVIVSIICQIFVQYLYATYLFSICLR